MIIGGLLEKAFSSCIIFNSRSSFYVYQSLWLALFVVGMKQDLFKMI
jgi:hypothetical protein